MDQSSRTEDHEATLKSVFSIDIFTDKENVHPQTICKRCYAEVSWSSKAEADGKSIFMLWNLLNGVCTLWRMDCMCVETSAQGKKEADPQKEGKGEGDHHRMVHTHFSQRHRNLHPLVSSLRSRRSLNHPPPQQSLASNPHIC